MEKTLSTEIDLIKLLNSSPEFREGLFSKVLEGYTTGIKVGKHHINNQEALYGLLTHYNPNAEIITNLSLTNIINYGHEHGLFYSPHANMVDTKKLSQLTIIRSNQQTVATNADRLYLNIDNSERDYLLTDLMDMVERYELDNRVKLNFSIKFATDNERLDNVVIYCDSKKDLEQLTMILTHLHNHPNSEDSHTTFINNLPLGVVSLGADQNGKGWLGYNHGGDSAHNKIAKQIEQALFSTISQYRQFFQLSEQDLSSFAKELSKAYSKNHSLRKTSLSFMDFFRTNKTEKTKLSNIENYASNYYSTFMQNGNLPTGQELYGVTAEDMVNALLSTATLDAEQRQTLANALAQNIASIIPNVQIPESVVNTTNGSNNIATK